MNKIRKIAIVAVCILSAMSVYAGTPKYQLVWEDYFRGETMNSEYWSTLHRSPADWNRYMSACPAVYEQKNNRLRLFAKLNDGLDANDSAKYLTGGVSTLNKKSIKYGKIEVKARIKGGRGTWLAIWLMPLDLKNWEYPYRAEIDVMECLHNNNFVYQTVHTYYTDVLKQVEKPSRQTKTPIKQGQYNVYTLEILPDELVFSVNGKVSFVYPRYRRCS